MIHQKRDESCASQPATGGESAAFASSTASGSSFPCDDSFWKVFDDVCKDYMLTPPQSPPVGLAFDNEPLLMDESLSAALDSLLEETSGLSDPGLAQVIDSFESDMHILSDCMWSGSDDCKSSSLTGKNSDSCLLLAAGSAFENILTVSEEPLVAAETLTSNFEDEDEEEDENEVPDSSDSDESDEHIFISSCSRLCPGTDSLIDHSYGSTCPPDVPDAAAQSPHKLMPRSPAKASKRLSSSSSSSCSSTSLLSNEYHTGKSKRLAEKRRAKQKLLDADPVTVKFVKRTPNSGSPVARKQAIRCAKRKSVTLAACTDRLSSAMATIASCPPESPARLSNLTPKSTARSCMSPVPSHANSCQSSQSPLSSCSSSPQSILSSPKKKKEKHFPERRREHNDSEKKRRDQLRNAFVCLRDQIPKLRDQGRRPPRIHILFEAASYVTTLADKSASLEKIKNSETAKREKLLRRLRMLQSQSS